MQALFLRRCKKYGSSNEFKKTRVKKLSCIIDCSPHVWKKEDDHFSISLNSIQGRQNLSDMIFFAYYSSSFSFFQTRLSVGTRRLLRCKAARRESRSSGPC